MLFRQLFEPVSSTYTYIIATNYGREALMIDPVKEQTPTYLRILKELDLKLVYAIDTHTHADHVTALGELRGNTQCTTMMGEHSQAECVSVYLKDDERINIDGIELQSLYTPGHTNESFSFYLHKGGPRMVFSGDTLLIRGSGRTDFQNGSAEASYHSITERLFTLPEETLVYPGHDYRGSTASSIWEEKRYNPRLAGKSLEEYVEIMDNLKLVNPKLMDVAIPANLACGNV
ncbi:MBL-fold metallo-hydrolase superfamily [hydrothermal vent metagenome]|uniref:MBL-fold metallo-hydrolase superfamily n=1 Tax=hydrothermal vent metagenome TaxID=652676 RepID=A0A3B1A6G9_9ZZZZ